MSNNLTERLRVDAERWMSGDFGRDNEEAGMLSHEAAEEIAALRERVEALEAAVERAIRQAQNIGIDRGSYYEGLLAALGADIGGGRG